MSQNFEAPDPELAPKGTGHGGSTHMDTGVLTGETAPPILTHKRMLRDKNFSDVTISAGRKNILLHSYVLWLRGPELIPAKEKTNLEKNKKKKASSNLTFNLKEGITPQTLWQISEYIYGGNVRLSCLTPAEILYLNVGAKVFKLDRLSYLCERYLKETMTMEVVFGLLRLAHDLKEENVKNFCLSYAIKNYPQFIGNKDGVHILGIDLFQEVVTKSQDSSSVKDDLPATAPANHYYDHWRQLHDEMLWSDSAAKVGSEKIKFHKAVLAAHSDGLAAYFRVNQNDEVPFMYITPDAFRALLRFVYYGDRNIPPLPATELISFSKQFDLPDLAKACEDKIKDSIAIDTVLEILSVTYLPHLSSREDIQDLWKKCITFILDNIGSIDLLPLKKMQPTIAIDVLFACQNREKGAKNPIKVTSATALEEDAQKFGKDTGAFPAVNTLDVSDKGKEPDTPKDSSNNPPSTGTTPRNDSTTPPLESQPSGKSLTKKEQEKLKTEEKKKKEEEDKKKKEDDKKKKKEEDDKKKKKDEDDKKKKKN